MMESNGEGSSSSNRPNVSRINSRPLFREPLSDIESGISLSDNEAHSTSEPQPPPPPYQNYHRPVQSIHTTGASMRRNSQMSQVSNVSQVSQVSRSLFRRTTQQDDENDTDWWMSPPNENAGGEPLRVDFRCACFKLTDASTVNFTAMVKFVVVFEWNDPRLKGMPMTTNDLPVDLWGPDIILENAQNDCAVLYDSFSLIDSARGRLKRTVTFHGHVYNPMSLKDFPFDEDDLEMKFISICNWRTLDGSRHGNDPCNQVYVLKPMLDRENVPFFFLGWGGKINEFHMLGWVVDVINPNNDPSKPIIFKFDIQLARKWIYYLWKVLFPLWLIVLTSLAPYGIATDDFQGRLEVIFTLLLSTVALLYVVQESIPKVSFLTTVDKIVIATLLALSFSVLFSYLIKKSSHPEILNTILAVVNQVSYWVANIVLIVPPYLRYKRHIAKVEAQQESKDISASTKSRPPSMLLHQSQSLMRMDKSYSFAPKSFTDEESPVSCEANALTNPANPPSEGRGGSGAQSLKKALSLGRLKKSYSFVQKGGGVLGAPDHEALIELEMSERSGM